jgi:tetratricopeptide (TPR) repeat protein
MRCHALAVFFALMGPLATSPIARNALAADDDRAIALDLFGQGRTLLKNGHYEAALKQFEAAAKVMRTFGVLLNIAECQEKLGRTASASATWREARAVAAAAHSADDEALAAERQKALEPKVSRLTIVVPSDADLPALEMRLDGVIVPREAWGTAIAVDPGAHVLEARAPGRTPRKIDVVARPEGDRSTTTIRALDTEAVPASPPAGPLTPIAIPAPGPTDASDAGSGQRVAGWILGSFGLAAAGSGIGIALYGQHEHNEAVATDYGGNLPKAQQMESTANTTKIIGYTVLGGGGAFLVSGVVLLLTAPSAPSSNASAMALTPWLSSTRGGGAVLSRDW